MGEDTTIRCRRHGHDGRNARLTNYMYVSQINMLQTQYCIDFYLIMVCVIFKHVSYHTNVYFAPDPVSNSEINFLTPKFQYNLTSTHPAPLLIVPIGTDTLKSQL